MYIIECEQEGTRLGEGMNGVNVRYGINILHFWQERIPHAEALWSRGTKLKRKNNIYMQNVSNCLLHICIQHILQHISEMPFLSPLCCNSTSDKTDGHGSSSSSGILIDC
jgi:hypothetical protein